MIPDTSALFVYKSNVYTDDGLLYLLNQQRHEELCSTTMCAHEVTDLKRALTLLAIDTGVDTARPDSYRSHEYPKTVFPGDDISVRPLEDFHVAAHQLGAKDAREGGATWRPMNAALISILVEKLTREFPNLHDRLTPDSFYEIGRQWQLGVNSVPRSQPETLTEQPVLLPSGERVLEFGNL